MLFTLFVFLGVGFVAFIESSLGVLIMAIVPGLMLYISLIIALTGYPPYLRWGTLANYLMQGPAPHIGTHAGTLAFVGLTTVKNAVIIGGSYDIGVVVGSAGRKIVNNTFRAIKRTS